MEILQCIASNNFITLNKQIMKKLGLNEAIIIGELASEYDYWNKKNELDDGYFYSTIKNVEDNTTLDGHKQRIAIKNLQKMGILDIKISGLPAKRFIKINEEMLFKVLNIQLLKNLTTSSEKNEQLDVKNFNTNNNIINNNINNNIYIERFNKFWEVYPKKVAKENAIKCFIKLKPSEELLKKILYAINIQKKQKQWQDKQYIPNPSTYLNQRRWEDEVVGESINEPNCFIKIKKKEIELTDEQRREFNDIKNGTWKPPTN